MARQDRQSLDYGAEVKKLRQEGPGRVYILRGEEDYLRDSFLAELKALCLPQGTEAFNYHRLQGPNLDMGALRESAEAMPFMGEHTLTEVRDFDVNRTSAYDAEALKAFLADVPQWATVAFVFSPGYAPDSRLGPVKAMKSAGADLAFSSPGEAALVRWVMRRAESLEKTIDPATANYLIWVCGSKMNGLIPEMVKIAGYARDKAITRADIDAVAKKAPETTIFDLTDALGAGEYDKAARLLADLLADKDEPPQKQIAMVSEQFRRLYFARLAADSGKGTAFITACVPELTGRSYPLQLLQKACRRFSADRLARAVDFCARCDYAMKDTGGDPEALMKELILRLAADRA